MHISPSVFDNKSSPRKSTYDFITLLPLGLPGSFGGGVTPSATKVPGATALGGSFGGGVTPSATKVPGATALGGSFGGGVTPSATKVPGATALGGSFGGGVTPSACKVFTIPAGATGAVSLGSLVPQIISPIESTAITRIARTVGW
jgi:hypothetical protein